MFFGIFSNVEANLCIGIILVCVQSMSEIRTFGFRTTPKSELFCVRFIDVRISDVRFNWRSDFGIYSIG